jgi:hypothetical protein
MFRLGMSNRRRRQSYLIILAAGYGMGSFARRQAVERNLSLVDERFNPLT